MGRAGPGEREGTVPVPGAFPPADASAIPREGGTLGHAAGMKEELALGLAAIVVLGFAAQWVATRLRIPSILLLLATGVVAGPSVTDLIDTDALLGELLFPAVSLGVAILLFEGGLGLRYSALPGEGRLPVLRLVTLGAAVTWVLATLALMVVGVDLAVASVVGAILTVSGPTVVLPLLRHVRPREPAASILRWEGIFIDPIGATLAIVVLDAVVEARGVPGAVSRIATTAGAGTVAGVLAALVLMVLLHFHLIPDELHNAATLAAVAGAFEGANLLRPEAGLFAATVLGVVLANQHRVPIGHVREFEEDLGRIILGALFIVLAARVDLDAIVEFLPRSLVVLAVLVIVVRPVAVWVSTVGTDLTRPARRFLVWMAPRGVVAIAVASLFAVELEEAGRHAEPVVPIVFTIVVGTVALYGLTARSVARWLRVARSEPKGLGFVGGPAWALAVGRELAAAEVPVIILTGDPTEAESARRHDLLQYTGPLDSEELEEAVESAGVREVVATARIAEVNAYALDRLVDILGRAHVFHLPVGAGSANPAAHHVAVIARRPFRPDATQLFLEQALAANGRICSFAHGEEIPPGALGLVSVDAEGTPSVLRDGRDVTPPPGGRTVYLVFER